MIIGSLEYLRRPFVSNVRKGDKVLIITDTRQDERVWQASMSIVAELGADPTLAIFEPRPADYYDPPEIVSNAMLSANVNVLLASTAMLHSPASMHAMGQGIPSICMDGMVSLEMFQSGAATADYHEISVLKHYTARNVFGEGAKLARVVTDFGTDMTYSVEGRVFVPPIRDASWDPYLAFKRTEEGRVGSPMYTCLFPGGEYNVPPLEYTAEGKFVIDTTMHHLGRLESPIELLVRDGRIQDIRGGVDAWRLRRHMETYGDDNAYLFPTEASVGLNRKAQVRGTQREDKNIYGSMHFGLGTNADVGGTIHSNLHMDGVLLQPTLYVDGVCKIERGQFTVPLDRPL